MKNLKTIQILAFLMLIIFELAITSCSKNDDAPAPAVPSVKDIYTCGYEYNGAGKTVAKYWKNGTATNLTNGAQNAFALKIAVVNNDIYVAGYEYDGNMLQNIGKTV